MAGRVILMRAKRAEDLLSPALKRAKRGFIGLGGLPIDLAIIDGMHQFEFALRDFINIEKHSSPQSTNLSKRGWKDRCPTRLVSSTCRR